MLDVVSELHEVECEPIGENGRGIKWMAPSRRLLSATGGTAKSALIRLWKSGASCAD